MKSFINKIQELVLSKPTLFTVIVSWAMIILSLHERGFWHWDGHFASESLLFQLVVVLNFPAILIASPFLSDKIFMNQGEPLRDAFVFIITITIQWILIGCMIKAAFFQKRRDAI
jgi:hypothetical protein